MLVGNLLLKIAPSCMSVPNVVNIVAPAVAEAIIPCVLHAKMHNLRYSERKIFMQKIKAGDFVFCLGDGIAIFPVVSVDEERGTAYLDPAVHDIGTGGNESLDNLELVRDSEHADSFPQFC